MKQLVSTAVAVVAACGMTLAHAHSQAPPAGGGLTGTKQFIERELPLVGEFSVVTKHATGRSYEVKHVIRKVSLVDCRLAISRTFQPYYNMTDGRNVILTHFETVDLKQVDVSSVKVQEAPVMSGTTASRASFEIPLNAIARGDKPFSDVTEGGGTPRRIVPLSIVTVRVADNAAAVRIADALRNAAVMCAAPNQPSQTAPQLPGPAPNQPAGKAAELPAASPAGSTTMTNDDVVRMVAAGLSDQVVATAIRQAPNKQFDVTPIGLLALKKANVPDAVMVAMLEKGPGAPAAPPSEPKPAPKYDAELAKPTPPPPPPREPSNGCESIEAMGLFKNVTGVANLVEWLARIRNNGGVTRIVVYGWTDMYGADQKGQVQIQGGQIASIRLDLTQNMVIPPVKYLRLVSCR